MKTPLYPRRPAYAFLPVLPCARCATPTRGHTCSTHPWGCGKRRLEGDPFICFCCAHPYDPTAEKWAVPRVVGPLTEQEQRDAVYEWFEMRESGRGNAGVSAARLCWLRRAAKRLGIPWPELRRRRGDGGKWSVADPA